MDIIESIKQLKYEYMKQNRVAINLVAVIGYSEEEVYSGGIVYGCLLVTAPDYKDTVIVRPGRYLK